MGDMRAVRLYLLLSATLLSSCHSMTPPFDWVTKVHVVYMTHLGQYSTHPIHPRLLTAPSVCL